MKQSKIRRVIGFILIGIIGVSVFAGVVMLLWNALLPTLFHLPAVTFWQALGLLVLAKLLFGGFRGGWGGRHRWNHQMRDKWMKMTPEEREKFKQEWSSRCGPRRFRSFDQEPSPEQKPAQ
jgi:Ca2+/H+ antiporter, TMEM165/GDT1 family